MIASTRRRTRLGFFAAWQATAPGKPVSAEVQISHMAAYPLREPISKRAYTVVELQTESGLKGYGECPNVPAGETAQALRILRGRPATSYEPIDKELEQSGVRGAVNMALLDVVGKFTKAPIYQLLGGPTRAKARAMTALKGSDDLQLAASLKMGIAAGYRAFVVPLPMLSPSERVRNFVRPVQARIESLRAAAGDDVDFVLDGAGALSSREASILCAALERLHLLWLDEPSGISDLSALRKLTPETVTPLGFGRDVTRAGEFQNLLREKIIDIVRPRVSRNGITSIRRIAAIAETYYVAVAPHHEGGPIATAAALHLAASIPNFFIQQIPLADADADHMMRAEITSNSVEIVKEGFAQLPYGPGLGVDVNPEALRKYKDLV